MHSEFNIKEAFLVTNDYNIENVNKKSFDNYTYLDSESKHSMSKVNVFFGCNGSGKTALAQYFYEKSPETTKIFNSSYVRNNILKQQGVQGSSIIIGNENINLQREIDSLKNDLDKITNEGTQLKEEKEILSSEIENQMREIIISQKDNFLTRIKQKPNAKENPQNAFNLWKKDSQLNIQSSAKSINELDKEIGLLTSQLNAPLQNFLSLKDSFVENIQKYLHKKVIRPQGKINHELIDWLKKGIYLHNLTENSKEMKCLFCGENFNGHSTLKLLQRKIDNNYSLLTEKLQSFENILNKSNQQLINYNNIMGKENTGKIASILQPFFDAIQQKKNGPEKEILISNNSQKALFDKINNISQTVKSNQFRLQKLQEERANKEKIARKRTGELIVKNKIINDNLDSLKEKESTIKTKRNDYEVTRNKLVKLEDQSKDYTGFMQLINKQLYLAGADYSLKVNNSTNGVFNVVVNDSSLNIDNKQLSEGEIRLIAFLKFYYELFLRIGNNNTQLKQDIDTIIFDDPITSIDANNRIFILDLINRLIDNYVDKSDIGILIFTHSDYDFHNFAYFYKDARRFIIKKDEHEHSEVKFLTKDAFLNFSNTYKSSFEDIVEFATKSRNKLSVFNNYLKYGNQARYVLETHARSNYEIHYATESGIGQLAIYYNITASEENAVKTMLNTINSLSHGTSYMQGISNEPFAPEIQKAIRILILLIYRKDKQHVKCMSGDYWGTLKNAIHTWHYLDTSK